MGAHPGPAEQRPATVITTVEYTEVGHVYQPRDLVWLLRHASQVHDIRVWEAATGTAAAMLARGSGRDEHGSWDFWMQWPDRSILRAWLNRPSLDGVHVTWMRDVGEAEIFAIDFYGRRYIVHGGNVYWSGGAIVRPEA